MATHTIAAGAVAMLLLAACGSDDAAAPAVTPTTTAPTTTTKPTTPPSSLPAPTPSPETTVDDGDTGRVTSYQSPIDLGGTSAHDINNSGVIVGTLGGVSGEDEHGTVGQDDAKAIWWPEPNLDPQLLDVAPSELSFGLAVNDEGEILVRTGHPEGPTAALVVDPQSGVIAELPAPENGFAEAWAFNDRAEVLVRIRQGWEQSLPMFVVWHARTGSIEVPPGLDGQEYVLSDINDHGDVVGHVLAPFGAPFFWDRTRNVLHYLDVGDAEQGYATALNDHGQIVGLVRADMQAPDRAAVWDDHSSPPQVFDHCGRFTDINNSGHLLCGTWVSHPESNQVAQLPAITGNAAAINDLGQVVGQADGHAALWNPVGDWTPTAPTTTPTPSSTTTVPPTPTPVPTEAPAETELPAETTTTFPAVTTTTTTVPAATTTVPTPTTPVPTTTP